MEEAGALLGRREEQPELGFGTTDVEGGEMAVRWHHQLDGHEF